MEPGLITQFLIRSRDGDRNAMDSLFPMVYDELSRIAHRQLYRSRPGETLNTSALVHDAYLRMVDQTRVNWQDRSHFFATASRAMRQILVDFARRKAAQKRGSNAARTDLEAVDLSSEEQAEMVVALDEALERLTSVDERLSRVVECRFFGGLTEEETAEVLGVSDRTVRRDWIKAKAWLLVELTN